MFLFDKNRRLLKKSDFDFVFSQAKKLETREFIILYRQNAKDFARIGFAFSKKKIAKAHDRNRMKRLVRESFRIRELPAFDMIFLAKRSVEMETNAEITAGLKNAWQKLTTMS